jgi:hypothetical protein
MAAAWRHAANDLAIRFESPFAMEYQGQTYWCSGWLPDFGNDRGTIIAGRHAVDEIFDVAFALGYYTSGLSPYHYEQYDRDLFIETLNDWGWFGDKDKSPAWFAGGYCRHGGPE